MPPATDDHDPSALTDAVLAAGRRGGLDAVGVTTAEVLEPARSVLPRRKASGLSADMMFTYRNPDRSSDPTRALPGAVSVVAGAVNYRRGDVEAPDGLHGRVAHYAWTDHYGRLRDALEAAADVLRAAGYLAQVHADDNHLVDRNVAYRAGLGWYGKNANLLVPEAGSWFVLGGIITDAPLTPSRTVASDGCGSCRRCIDECPTAAIVAPGVVDARRCLAWLVQARGAIPVEFRAALGDRLYGCDECQEVCPPNLGLDRHSPPPPADAAADPWIDIAWVLEAEDQQLMARVGRWYLADRNPDVVRRTALVILGNLGRGRPETGPLIDRYLDHPNELLRAHAVWAARRCGLDQLAERRRDDPSDLVRAEFHGVVEPAVMSTRRDADEQAN
ncbi:MAG: tRNA epoxyqueuosine(34) reductase QueG [Acidimicrobiales bacterium]